MQEPGILDTEAEFTRGPLGEMLYEVTRIFALIGGLGFIALVPVPGDIEVMQMGTAIASAAMLAYCEMERHHLRVDFFTASVSPKTREVLDAISHLLLALVAALIAWRTAVSAVSIKEAGETSMILAWPVWMVVAAIVPSFILLAVAGLYNAITHWQLATAGESA